MESNKKKKQTAKSGRSTKQKLQTRPKPPPSSPPSPFYSSSSSSSSSNSCCSSSASCCYCCSSPASSTSPEEEPAVLPPVISRVYEGPIVVEHYGNQWAIVKWNVPDFSRVRGRSHNSPYFTIGGFDYRLMVYPRGDLVALPGHSSLYLQVMDPRSTKFDCFVSYTLKFVNYMEDTMSVCRESWHRFSSKKKSHGWSDFTQSSIVLDTKFGFLVNDTMTILADIRVLNESFTVSQDNNETKSQLATVSGSGADIFDGRIIWRLNNFLVFKDIFKTQKLVSPSFQVGECSVQLCVYRSWVNRVEYLSICLEGKEFTAERNCWCLFRVSVLNQKPSLNQFYKESYGRFEPDTNGGDVCSLGWIDYMKMSQFLESDNGFFVDGAVVFGTSFHTIKEIFYFTKNVGIIAWRGASVARKSDGFTGKFTWKIENFTKLKDLLKRKRIKNLCIKSMKFQIANRDCHLLLYPRGQSQRPCYLSMFLQVTDSLNTSSDWSCFVHYHMSVINQKGEERSVMKESRTRYSKSAKEFGWPEFVTLASLFDQDSGFLIQDTIIFSVDVHILKETSLFEDCTKSTNACFEIDQDKKLRSFTWKVENFLSFKEIMQNRKIFSKFFEVGGCELRIGFYESFGTISMFLECDPSAVSDPDKNFWISYRIGIMNQKDHNRSLWKESSLCTKTWSSSILQLINVADLLEAGAGYLVHEMVIFVCEILDYCPWFEFSDLEVLTPSSNQDTASESDKCAHSDESEVLSGDNTDRLKNLLSSAGFHLINGNNPSQPLVIPKEKVPLNAAKLAGFLINLRCNLDDSFKAKHGLPPSKFSSSNEERQDVTVDGESSPSEFFMRKIKVLQHAAIDLLLDIMVKFCQTSDGRSHEDSNDIHSDPLLDGHKAVNKLESYSENGGSDSVRFLIYGRGPRVDESACIRAIQFMGVDETDTSKRKIPDDHIFPPEISAGTILNLDSIQACQIECPGQSEELLESIVNSLKTKDVTFSQVFSELGQRTQFAQKVSFILTNAPKSLQPELVTLIPKLIDLSEHPLVACALLDQLQKPDAEPVLQLPVLAAISNLQFGSEVADHILIQVSSLLEELKDEPLAHAIDFLFKVASRCQKHLQTVRVVRARLQHLGAEVSACVLEALSKAVINCSEIAEAMLRDIKSVSEPDGKCLVKEQLLHFSDIHVLVEMLSIPSLTVEVSQAFERAIVRGIIMDQSMEMVLERRRAQSSSADSLSSAQKDLHKGMALGEQTGSLPAQEVDFTLVLCLARTLALSKDTRVHGFVRMLHAALFKIFPTEDYRKKMLKKLLECAITPEHSNEINIDLDVLASLVHEEQGIAKQVINMMKEVVELSYVDSATLRDQLRAKEKETIHSQEVTQAELSSMLRERAILLERLSESEATIDHLKSKLRLGKEHFAQEKMELMSQMREVENRLERLRSERDSKISKLSMEKKLYQDRLHDVEAQQSQLKLQKNDELKRVVKEKNALAERLKSAEATINRCKEEVKRHASEAVTREEVRKSLQNEIQWFEQKVKQMELEKGQKEERIASCEAHITSMEAKLNECQTYISSLEVALRDEMLQHAPLYGVGLEDMSVEELNTLSSIHEEGLRTIHSLKQHKGIPHRNALMSLSTTATQPPPQASDGVLHRNEQHISMAGTDTPLNYT